MTLPAELPPPRETSVQSGVRRLDARLRLPFSRPRGALLATHPHPAHGGHMDHAVVQLVLERAARAGLAALAFDFSGVRLSEGDVSDATAHLDDVRHGALAVRRRAPEGPLLGGGFSYGARMLARAVHGATEGRPGFEGLLLLAPATRVPRTRSDFGNLLVGRPLKEAPPDEQALAVLGGIPVPACVIVGERDQVAPPDELEAVLPDHVVLEVLPEVNHFFSRAPGAGSTAREILSPALDRGLRRLLEQTAS